MQTPITPVKVNGRLKQAIRRFGKEKTLWLICGFALTWVIIFAYIPIMGVITAFFNYIPGMSLFETEFVGLRYFKEFLMLPDFGRILRNTLVISGLNLTIGFAAPIVFALLLNEVYHSGFKRIVQTISYLPYFVSWVVVASIMTTLLNSNGVINEVLIALGIVDSAIPFLNSSGLFWGIMTTAGIWKGVGWSAIIYISAIAGVDQELYQAGAIDGLNRFGRVLHITMPSIAPTIILLFILGIGSLLSTGYEYQLLLGTPMTRDVYEVIDTYVYRYGIQMGRYSFAVAVGLLKSVIGFTLVLIANTISRRINETSIF